MVNVRLPPLDEINVIAMLLAATIAFDCSGARFAEGIDATEAMELLDLVEGQDDRIFFAAQTAAELKTIFDRKMSESKGHALSRVSKMITIERKRWSPIKSSVDDIMESVLSVLLLTEERLHSEDHRYNPVARRLLDIAERRTGPAYDVTEEARAYTEARARFDADIPPGYCDDNAWRIKNKYSSGKGKNPPDSYADYVLWRQLLDHVKSSGRALLLVTNDMKPDWWDHDDRGGALAPKSDLRIEMRRLTGQSFYAITFAQFRSLAPKALLPNVPSKLVGSALFKQLKAPWYVPRDPMFPWMTAAGIATFTSSQLSLVSRGPALLEFQRVWDEIHPKLDVSRIANSDMARLIAGTGSSRFLDGLNIANSDMARLIAGTGSSRFLDGLNIANSDVARLIASAGSRDRFLNGLNIAGIAADLKLPPSSALSSAIAAAAASAAVIQPYLSGLESDLRSLARATSGPSLAREMRDFETGIGSFMDSVRQFRENEESMVRSALGAGTEMVGPTAASHPAIRAYAEENELMERPIREVVARMRRDRLRRESAVVERSQDVDDNDETIRVDPGAEHNS